MAKIIENFKHYCNELLASFKTKNKKKTLGWISRLESENQEELGLGEEFKIQFLISLNGFIAKQIGNIKANIDNPEKCNELVNAILEVLKKVVDQREVRDEVIGDTIWPIFKSWKYKKKGRAFVKEEKRVVKKVNVYSSHSNDYYDVDFIFEIEIIGPNTHLVGQRVNERWFRLNQDADPIKIRGKIAAHLQNELKPFLDKF